jgi:hypothetical protein
MSNNSLKVRLRETFAQFEAGSVSFASMSMTLDNTVRAFESVPYAILRELEATILELNIENGYEQEGCESNVRNVIGRVQLLLEKIPD